AAPSSAVRDEKLMPESKFRNASATAKSAARSLSPSQNRNLRPAGIPLAAPTAMPVNHTTYHEPAAADCSLAASGPKSALGPILLASFLFALVLSIPVTSTAVTCGGNGQRACCIGEGDPCDTIAGVTLGYSTPCNPNPTGCTCSGPLGIPDTGMCFL